MHLSVQPSNGHFLGTQYIGFHWAYQLPAFHLQLFPLESLDVCCTCRLHLLLKAEVNICSAVLKHRKVYHTVMLSRTGKLPPKPPKKNASVSLNQNESLGSRSVLVQFSMLCSCPLFVCTKITTENWCCCQCIQLYILLNACLHPIVCLIATMHDENITIWTSLELI